MIDGVIKYTLYHDSGEPPEQAMVDSLESVRTRLYEMNYIGAYPDGVGYGNISLKMTSGFVITGTQTGHLKHLDCRSYAHVKSWDFSEFSLSSKGPVKPSSEALTHAAIYEASPETGSVIHVHSEPLWNRLLKNGECSTGDIPYGTQAMVEEVFRLFHDGKMEHSRFVMRGHQDGVVAFGPDLAAAMLALLRE